MKFIRRRTAKRLLQLFDLMVIAGMILQPMAPVFVVGQVVDQSPVEASDTPTAGDGQDEKPDSGKDASKDEPSADPDAVPTDADDADDTSAPTESEPVTDPTGGNSDAEGDAPLSEPVADENVPVVGDNPSEPTESASGIPTEPTVEAAGEASVEREDEGGTGSDVSSDSFWRDNGDGSMTIAVTVGVEYEFRDTGFKIKFTRIDEAANADNPREITVRTVKLPTEMAERLSAVTPVAWEVVSTMADGTFEYDLTLPLPTGVESDNVGVLYAENERELGEMDKITVVDPDDVLVNESEGEARVHELDHFTLYVAYEVGETRICHATHQGTEKAGQHAYVSIVPANTGILKGHIGNHGGKDIIPPIPDVLPYGFNWNDEEQKIWENDCNPIPEVVCGDGDVDKGETCDYGDLNGESNCSKTCQWVTPVCSGDSVTNGDFENPKVTDPSGWDIFDSSDVPGWKAKWYDGVSSYEGNNEVYNRPDPKIEIHAGVNGWGSADDQYVELDTDWVGPGEPLSGEPSSIALSQKIPVKPGYKYTLSFDYAARPNHSDNRIKVLVDDVEVFDSGVIAGGSSIQWINRVHTFIAEDDLVEVRFIETGKADSLGMFLDKVSLACDGPEIPVYTGEGYCPKEKPNKVRIGTYTVDSRDADGIEVPMTSDTTYLFEASGTFRSSSGAHRSDAGYTTIDNWATLAPEFGIHGIGVDYAAHALLGDMGTGTVGVIDWGAYDSDHTYAIASTAASSGVSRFLIGDRYGDWFDTEWQNQGGMSDNEGALSLDVSECRPEPKPAAKIVASKIVCDDESLLPNWGGGARETIDANTATDWLNDEQYPDRAEHCDLVADWQFQWRGQGGDTPSDVASGELPEWNTFTGNVEVPLTGATTGRIEVREILPDASYMTFSGGSNAVSPEFYCSGDTVNYDNWEWLNNPKDGAEYYCVGWNVPREKTSDVQICKRDDDGQGLSGWNVGLADGTPVVAETPINVTDGTGTNTDSLPAGTYLVKVGGTYRYGSESMIADAGYSYRPIGIPEGCDCWKSGVELSISYALMASVNGKDTYWGAYEDSHSYFTLVEHTGGVMNVSLYDNNYSDNSNNGDFRFEVFAIGEERSGTTGENGCVTMDDVPYGTYELGEAQKLGWEYLRGAGPVTVDDPTETFAIVNEPEEVKPEPVTVVASKIVCTDENDLPDWGLGGANITPTTAADWVSTHESCSLVKDWQFQWSIDGVGNPGDNELAGGTNWNTFGPTGSDGTATVAIEDPATVRLWFREMPKAGYIPFTYAISGNSSDVTAEFYCNDDVLNYDNWEWIDTKPGETYHCVAWNVPEYGEVVVTKFEDVNGDSQFGEGESTLPGWEMNLSDTEQTTGVDGTTTFKVVPGTKYLSETMQTGWTQTTTYCDNDPVDIVEDETEPQRTLSDTPSETYEFSVGPGETVNCYVGNQRLGTLSIQKTNNALSTLLPGGIVRYTIVVRAHGGNVRRVTVTDLPPEMFTYVSGSWGAVSSLGSGHAGELKLDKIYASPGVWDLGDMAEGEEVTLTYDTTIAPETDPGTYPDIAYARGGVGGLELAIADGLGSINDNYVGTVVAIADTEVPVRVAVRTEYDYETETVKKRVAGASIELPATGSSPLAPLVAFLALLSGLGIYGGRAAQRAGMRFARAKASVFAFIVAAGVIGSGANASAANLIVRIEDPQPATNGSFSIDYVALDVLGRPIELSCQVRAPGAASFVTFESVSLIAGGDSGTCTVDDVILADDGSYEFKAVATAGGDAVESDVRVISYDRTTPGRPKYIEKDDVSDCRYKVTFKTANDGQTASVRVYRSDDDNYTADASTEVLSVAVGPDVKYSFTDHLPADDCGTYYYAVRAFDAAGNPSAIREESVLKTEKETVVVTEEGTTIVTVGTSPAGAESGTGEVSGAGTVTEEPAAMGGEVAGEEAEAGRVEGAEVEKSGQKTMWTLAIVAAIAAWYAYRRYRASATKGFQE